MGPTTARRWRTGRSWQSTLGEDIDGSESRSGDEEFISGFKERAGKDGSIKYEEAVVKDAAEAVEVMRAHKSCNLFLVGRISEGELAAPMKRKSEFPELGPIGNVLISAELSTAASVLVMQQYRSQLSGYSLKSLQEDEAASKMEDSDSDF